MTIKPSHIRAGDVVAFALEPRVPPDEIQLWNVGNNPTDYGIHVWSQRSVDEVLSRYRERGNRLLIDVEHNGAVVDGEPAPTGGYAQLEVRDGAPWLVFEWSAYGAEQIATGQRRHVSPEYDVDPDSREIIRLYRVSLVADPGTYRARVLAAASHPEGTQMDPTLAAIQAILEGVSDPVEAIASIKSAIASLSNADAPADDTPTDPVDPAPAFAAAPPFAAGADDKPAGEKKVAASAEVPKPEKPAEPAKVEEPAVDLEAVRAVKVAAAAAVRRVEDSERDHMLATYGHRLAPSTRLWASSQPLGVVRGLIASAPETPAVPVRASATRGAGHGTGEVRKGLEGKDLEELQRGMGTFKASTPNVPYTNERGDFVLPTVTPTEHRKIMAAAAAKEGK